jgi:hypothetical protein
MRSGAGHGWFAAAGIISPDSELHQSKDHNENPNLPRYILENIHSLHNNNVA